MFICFKVSLSQKCLIGILISWFHFIYSFFKKKISSFINWWALVSATNIWKQTEKLEMLIKKWSQNMSVCTKSKMWCFVAWQTININHFACVNRFFLSNHNSMKNKFIFGCFELFLSFSLSLSLIELNTLDNFSVLLMLKVK